MPELPEVETIRLGLTNYLPGQEIKRAKLINPSSFKAVSSEINQFLIGATVLKVGRRAKVLVLELNSGYSLIIHLKMTGQLIFLDQKTRYGGGHPSDSLINQLPDRSTRVILSFKSGAKLFFNDQRKFGWLKLVPTALLEQMVFSKLGPEPLLADFSRQVLRDRLSRRPRTPIKAALLDQSVIAGVGNIYADEALFGAKIHPACPVELLTRAQIRRLHDELIYILKLAIKSGGSSDRNYLNADGKRGTYLKFAKVYHRQGLPCQRCGHLIIKIKAAGRGTHICPFEQKLPRQMAAKIKPR